LDRELAARRLVPIHLTREEVDAYYEGFCNRVLWPLFHYLIGHVPLAPWQWEAYRAVNERFAQEIASRAREGDRVWVHDYQLCLVPGLLRKLRPDLAIGFFLHIPFPAADVLQVLPWRRPLLEGLLGADLVGFHTWRYQHHFVESVGRLLGLATSPERIVVGERVVRVGTYPMGVDARAFGTAARRPDVLEQTEKIRADAPGARILLGVDRLDYTKGIRRRMLALDQLLRREPSLREKVKLVQIAVPSRTNITEYEQFRQNVDEVAGRVNGAHATATWVPIHYLCRGFTQDELVSFYLAADVMFVTPLRDGMNLVAKEFVASRGDERGVLVLSEMAGAAAELGRALLVNPYDGEGMGTALLEALGMSEEEQRERMRDMRERVFGWDVHRWVRTFLGDLGSEPLRVARLERSTPSAELGRAIASVASAPARALLLDLDGTLIPFERTPGEAAPDAELLDLLDALAALPRTRVHVVSGRPAGALEAWFGELPLGLHAEHGLLSRSPDGEWVQVPAPPAAWKERVRPVLDALRWRTPGALVEEKSYSLAFHYRAVDPEMGALRAASLVESLGPIAAGLDLEVLSGSCVVEVRPRGVHKGLVVPSATAGLPEGAAIVALGDDTTDEDLFAALPPGALAVHVGPKASRAPLRLPSIRAARAFLAAIVAAMTTGAERARAEPSPAPA